jgi:hypothetical protein
MNRIQFACYCLIASAFVLGGLLLVTAQQRLPTAEAALVVHRDTFTMLTSQARQGDDALFVLDSVNEKLLIYSIRLSGTRGRMSLVQVADLGSFFASLGDGGGKGLPRP